MLNPQTSNSAVKGLPSQLLLMFDAATQEWEASLIPEYNDGTGLAGGRFLRACKYGYDYGDPLLTREVFLFMNAGQDIAYVRLSPTTYKNAFQWNTLVTAFQNDNPHGIVHSDLWDIFLSHAGWLAVASDGGVFEAAEFLPQQNSGWRSRNLGLNTQHVGDVQVLLGGVVAYTTVDNDAWLFAPLCGGRNCWQSPLCQRDVRHRPFEN